MPEREPLLQTPEEVAENAGTGASAPGRPSPSAIAPTAAG